jgi:hypothetical protein
MNTRETFFRTILDELIQKYHMTEIPVLPKSKWPIRLHNCELGRLCCHGKEITILLNESNIITLGVHYQQISLYNPESFRQLNHIIEQYMVAYPHTSDEVDCFD